MSRNNSRVVDKCLLIAGPPRLPAQNAHTLPGWRPFWDSIGSADECNWPAHCCRRNLQTPSGRPMYRKRGRRDPCCRRRRCLIGRFLSNGSCGRAPLCHARPCAPGSERVASRPLTAFCATPTDICSFSPRPFWKTCCGYTSSQLHMLGFVGPWK